MLLRTLTALKPSLLLNSVGIATPLQAPDSASGAPETYLTPTVLPERLQTQTNLPIAVAATGIHMAFGSDPQKIEILKDVNLSVPQGKVQMLMGPAGAGKTTLLLIMAGLLTPNAGRVQLLGQDITGMTRQQLAWFRLKNMGIVFQENNLLRSLTALENIEIILNLKGIVGDRARQEARQLLVSVGLGDKAYRLPRHLSGGQQQRLGVARALAGNPPLIIADEPTSALDSHNGRMVIELLSSHAREKGSTILLATHDARITSFADQVLYLEDGILTAPK